MYRTFGQLQQDLANNPILFADELPPRHLEAGQYLKKMVDAELYNKFLNEFHERFPDLIETGFGYHCIAFCQLYKGDKEAARETIATAIKIRLATHDPGVWASYQVYGRILDMLWNDYEGAMSQFKVALMLRPAEPLVIIGMLCAASKYRDQSMCVSIIKNELSGITPPWPANLWIVDRLEHDLELVFARSLDIWEQDIKGKLTVSTPGEEDEQ